MYLRDFLTQKYYTSSILGYLHPVALPRGSSKIRVKNTSKKCEFMYIGQTYEVKIKYEGIYYGHLIHGAYINTGCANKLTEQKNSFVKEKYRITDDQQ